MPHNLSAWMDLAAVLAAALALVALLACFDPIMGLMALIIWLSMAALAYRRCITRRHAFEDYCHNIISNANAISNYAIDQLPQIIMVVNKAGRLMWFNKELEKRIDIDPSYGMPMDAFWPELNLEPVWGTIGEMIFIHNNIHYKLIHRPVATVDDPNGLMALYIADTTEFQELLRDFNNSRTSIACIQIDNHEEVLKGLPEAERTTLVYETNKLIDEWVTNLHGFLSRVSNGHYIAVMERQYLEKAIENKFDILDKVRRIENSKKQPMTISMGIAVADNQSMEELGMLAQSGLDLALGRGGDQVAVNILGKTQFFGGLTQAVEKNTRVKARVVANALHEIISKSDEVFIMGHHNEDFDALGAAMGIAKMAKHLQKPAHIILSNMNEGIDKFTEILKTKEAYEDLFISADMINNITAQNPLLFVVDTHIPYLTAAPELLDRISQVVIIDHHRRSESSIKSPLLAYLEPSPSSCSEMVSELLMYFDDKLTLSRMEATALYAGILVDTKNFVVQTGVRTFDAAAYLRRSGVDPVIIRQIFRSDYETDLAKAKAKAASKLHPNGLITTTCPQTMPNIQVIAAQVADSMLRIEKVRVSIVVFQLKPDTVAISARSSGSINVQVIMEHFGGGGHQNVAGAQISGRSLEEIYQEVIDISNKYIEEIDKNESNTAAGH